MHIRPAATADLAGIAAIYDPEVLHGTATFMTVPRTAAQWRAWLAEHDPPRHPVLVADDGTVAGWASLSPWSVREAYARSAESSVYVHPDRQGRGVGRALMRRLLDDAPRHGVAVVIARVCDENTASVRFHESLGFRTVGVQRRIGEKFGRLLDVRIMDAHLDA